MAVQLDNLQKLDEPPLIFISYSHKDEVWKDRLRPHLGLLERDDRIVIWDDRQIEPTAEWYDEIKRVMARASIAICLISADYLNSEFCTKEEIPYLLRRRKEEGLHLFLVLLRPCAWQALSWLKTLQMLPRDGKAIARDFRDDWDTPFAELATYVFGKLPKAAPSEPCRDQSVLGSVRRPPRVVIDYAPEWREPEVADVRIDLDRLPATGAELFGRQQELTLLDGAWASGTAHVVSLVAWGGVGKSTLINKWLESMKADTWRGAKRVYGWSFHSQGMGERATSADEFIARALHFFGDPDPTQGSPWSKGERLAELLRKERALLVLDGLEPLQSRHERGRLSDPGIGRLIEELAHENPGLCLITTRERVAELDEDDWRAFVQQVDLEQISPQAGRALLRVKGVRGSDAKLEQASRDFGNNALAINLLAAYLHGNPGHRIEDAERIPDPEFPEEEGGHARRVLEAFARSFGDGRELDVLKLMGLFQRPADAGCIAALRRPAAIPGLTDHVVRNEGGTLIRWWRRFAGNDGQASADELWRKTLDGLRELALIAPMRQYAPDELDAHPLVREHFGARLKAEQPKAWRAGHGRLYEHLRDSAKPLPDTLAEMAPLFQAMHHGCQAGRHQKACGEIYIPRIARGGFVVRQLAAFGSVLSALADFFEDGWRKPTPNLWAPHQALLLNHAAFCLRALGRLKEAVAPMRLAMDHYIGQKDWGGAAVAAQNLSELLLLVGEVAAAVCLGEAGVAHAERSNKDRQLVNLHTTLATALHQAGEPARAQMLFEMAEKLQANDQPAYPRLYSLRGYEYCDLLLAQGHLADVRARAVQTLGWGSGHASLLDVALDRLSLGRAALALGENDKARTQLDQAVDGLRQAGAMHHLPSGLLARAVLFRECGEFDRVRRELDEAMRIAKRSEMRLFQCDAHLEYARLALAEGDKDRARGHVAEARRLVEECGYGRRRPEVAALEAEVR